ncbi:HK97-gp10 family putative phage morphogenesis protein [uncultured Microbulbifer sp.]|uniref:HK97-gp10 family putative phage morphogenesis protein n=1 Tax=uncultured Microbulbifer sp. TaxID=348147 RepID=UPI0026171B2B|nr:HK97-gp10 family putative phage morphogenesis protein [uncultured Microbulbifer sp.]
MDMKFDLHGMDEVIAGLQALEKDVKKKAARFALRKAAMLVLNEAVGNAKRVDDPLSVSVISENIALRFDNRHFKNTGELKFRVGVLGGANPKQKKFSEHLPGGGTQHWRLLEFGTEHIPAQPMMRPALSSNIDNATAEFARELDKWLQRYTRRMAKAGK